MGVHYVEHLERALDETAKAYEALVLKLGRAIEELKLCEIDLFEAEDKFHVLSFYIADKQSHECAVSRVKWMNEAARRVKETLDEIGGGK